MSARTLPAAIITLLVCLVTSPNAASVPIHYNFSGIVDGLTTSTDPALVGVSVGDPFSGSFLYDPSAHVIGGVANLFADYAGLFTQVHLAIGDQSQYLTGFVSLGYLERVEGVAPYFIQGQGLLTPPGGSLSFPASLPAVTSYQIILAGVAPPGVTTTGYPPPPNLDGWNLVAQLNMNLIGGRFLELVSRPGPLAVTSVPEPSTLSLLVGGLLAVFAMRKGRRATA